MGKVVPSVLSRSSPFQEPLSGIPSRIYGYGDELDVFRFTSQVLPNVVDVRGYDQTNIRTGSVDEGNNYDLPIKIGKRNISPNWFSRVKSGASGGFLYSVPSISVPSGPMHPASRKEKAKIAALTPTDIVLLLVRDYFTLLPLGSVCLLERARGSSPCLPTIPFASSACQL